ncbi:transposase for IS2404 [Mycobacterium liflandii 128FXT]|uniref:Transposase for IS2404 n=1 Tax=Mycobacterium liflandii (strain 128FXT) TaxID=459424 RepID=L7V4H6_MYCL1|nr:transposase for IS2404 [Mycobacterium liflandii 128FXT]
MHTQVVTAKLICATLKSHYLMIVKSNQAKILARITALPWAEVPTAATDDSRGHGRVETRTLQIITAARGIGFPYAKQIIRITRERLITATTSAAWRWSMPSAACRSSTPALPRS